MSAITVAAVSSASSGAKRKWDAAVENAEEPLPPAVDRATRRFKTPEEAEAALGLKKPLKQVVRELFKQPRCEQRTPEWYLARQCAITASDMLRAVGRSRQGILQKKVDGTGTETDDGGFSGAACEHGRKYEDCALYEYEKLTGYKTLDFGLLSHTDLYADLSEEDSRDPKKALDWFRDVHMDPTKSGLTYIKGSPDGIAVDPENGDTVLLEIKCPYATHTYVPQRVKREHYAQIQALLYLTKLEVAHLVQYRPKSGTFYEQKLDLTVVHRDEDYIGKIVWDSARTWAVIEELREKKPLVEADPNAPRTKQGTWKIPKQIFSDVPKYKFPACVYVMDTRTKQIRDANGAPYVPSYGEEASSESENEEEPAPQDAQAAAPAAAPAATPASKVDFV